MGGLEIMDGRMVEWMTGRINGWVDGWMERQVGG